MSAKFVLAGEKYGRWTVLDDFVLTEKGEKKWLCRCDCGTERYVLERGLKYGSSKSCGCLRIEEAQKAVAISGLEGRTFGELTVLYKAEHQRKNGGIWWTCRCSCGNLYDASASQLVTGRKTRCSSRAHEKNYAYEDISGQKFGRLTALYPSRRYDKSGSVIWRCRCDCGSETDISYNKLLYSNVQSCGCRKKEHDQKLQQYLTRVDGTSVDLLKSKKVPVNSTTGVKGVYRLKDKWAAKIVFQKKAYYLGSYDTMAEAAEARREAESLLFDGAVEHYQKWKEKAASDRLWGEENPVQIIVDQKSDKHLSVTFLPILQAK